MNDKSLEEILLRGYILYPKNGIIDYKELPDYGSITLKVKAGMIYQVDKTETTK